MKQNNFVRYILFSIAAFTLSCHSPSYYNGWGDQDNVSVIDRTEMPRLTNLRLVSLDGAQDIKYAPAFSPNINMYEADITTIELGGQYKVVAESKFPISYTNGPLFMPATVSYIIVTVANGNLKNSYIVSFKNDDLPYAKLRTMDISEGEIILPANGFDPDIYNYQIKIPYGLKTVAAAGTPNPDSGRVILSDSPLNLEEKDVLMIQVAAPGHNVSTYILKFNFGEGLPSYLEYVEFSSGSLDKPFKRDTLNYELTLTSADGLTAFGYIAPGGVVTYNQGISKHGGTYIAKPQNDTELIMTANNGVGYRPREYSFKIKIDPSAQQVKLTSLSWSPTSDNMLFKLDAGVRVTGSNGVGFDENHFNYEFYMEFGQPVGAQLAWTAACTVPGASISISHGTLTDTGTGTASITLPNQFDESIAVQIRVTAPGYLPSDYQVFFNTKEGLKPRAELKDLVVTGIVEGSMLPPVKPFDPSAEFYSANVLRDSPVLVRGVPAKPEFFVSYLPTDSIGSMQEKIEIKVKVDGGRHYQAVTYTVTLNVTERQNPYLAVLRVNEENVTLVDGQFLYNVPIPKSAGATQVPFYWDLQAPNDVKEVLYCTDGKNWTLDPGKHGEGLSVSLAATQSELIQIKTLCYDGNEAHYSVYLSREQGKDRSLYLTMIYLNGEPLADFNKDKTSYELYITSSASQEVRGETDVVGAEISYSENGLAWANNPLAITVELNQTKRVLVRITSDTRHNDYSVTITRATALYKVLSLNPSPAPDGKMEIMPQSVMVSGIPAGQPVAVTLKPTPGHKIHDDKHPVAKPASGGLEVEATGFIPTDGSSKTFYFDMPASDVNLEGYFEALVSTDNRLVNLTAIDNANRTLICMEPFNSNRGEISVVVTGDSATITPTAPSGAKLYKWNYYPMDSGFTLIADKGAIQVGSAAQPLFERQTTQLLIMVSPDNRSLGDNIYIVNITRVPAVENITAVIENLWYAPATGYYKFEAYGAEGGGTWGSEDGTPCPSSDPDGDYGGKGGYSTGVIHLQEGKEFTVTVGGKGGYGQLYTFFSGVTGRGGPGGYNGGGAGANAGGIGMFRTGGGGGGATDFKDGSERVLVAGGGGGAGSLVSKVQSGGDGGGGNGSDSDGGRMNSDHSRTDGKGIDYSDDGDNWFIGKGAGGGGWYGGAQCGGGSGYVKTTNGYFMDTGGQRGVQAENGKAVITWLGVVR